MKKLASTGGAAVKSRSATRAKQASKAVVAKPAVIPRATSALDDDDVLLSGGGSRSSGFGRCGGRMLSSRIEQTLCDKLSNASITHSHSPRHYEVRLGPKSVAAYAPMIVIRGRGREGKIVVIEAATELDQATVSKIVAFREKLGLEFYMVFVAPEEVLDHVSIAAYDESCAAADVDALVSRLAD